MVGVERESVAVRYVVGGLFGRDAISSNQGKIASGSTVKVAVTV